MTLNTFIFFIQSCALKHFLTIYVLYIIHYNNLMEAFFGKEKAEKQRCVIKLLT